MNYLNKATSAREVLETEIKDANVQHVGRNRGILFHGQNTAEFIRIRKVGTETARLITKAELPKVESVIARYGGAVKIESRKSGAVARRWIVGPVNLIESLFARI
jgi:hypothetical protein